MCRMPNALAAAQKRVVEYAPTRRGCAGNSAEPSLAMVLWGDPRTAFKGLQLLSPLKHQAGSFFLNMNNPTDLSPDPVWLM